MVVNSFLFILILALLALSIAAIILLGIYIYRYLVREIDVKRSVYAELNKNAKHGGIVFLGDSLTEFYRTGEFFHDAGIYNRGIASDTTIGVLNRLEDNVLCIEPRHVFLQIGINDLGERRKPDQIVANIRKIVDRIQGALPGTAIHVISLYPINKEVNLYGKALLRHHGKRDIERINRELEAYCRKVGADYIDVASSLKDERGNLRKEYTIEGLHISFLGYAKITEALRPYVS